MEYLIIPALELQSGDVLFVSTPEDPNVRLCGRVLTLETNGAENVSCQLRPLAGTSRTELALVTFPKQQLMGVARTPERVSVDIATMLGD